MFPCMVILYFCKFYYFKLSLLDVGIGGLQDQPGRNPATFLVRSFKGCYTECLTRPKQCCIYTCMLNT